MTLVELEGQFIKARTAFLQWCELHGHEGALRGRLSTLTAAQYVRDVEYSRNSPGYTEVPMGEVGRAYLDQVNLVYRAAKLYCIAEGEGITAAVHYRLSI